MSPKPRTRPRSRGVVDTSVLAAGVAGFKPDVEPSNDSAIFLRDWVEDDTFTWLMTADILEEYAAVLAELRVRPAVIGRLVKHGRKLDDRLNGKDVFRPVTLREWI